MRGTRLSIDLEHRSTWSGSDYIENRMQIDGYLYLRRKFQPRSVKLVIVAKSPQHQANH